MGRTYSKILRNLIEEDIEDNQKEEQSGFRALNSMWWEKMQEKTKERIYKTIVANITTYGTEV